MEVFRYRTLEPGFHPLLKVDFADYTYRVIVPGVGTLAYGENCEFVILLDDAENISAGEQLLDQSSLLERYEITDQAVGHIVEIARRLGQAVDRLERMGLAEDFDVDSVLAPEKSAARDAFLLLQQLLSGPPLPQNELHPCKGDLMLLARSNQDTESFSVTPEPTLELMWCWECGRILYRYDPADGTEVIKARYKGQLSREELGLRVRCVDAAEAFRIVQSY